MELIIVETFTVATLYNLSSFDMVTVTKIHKSEEAVVLETVQADHLTLTIKVWEMVIISHYAIQVLEKVRFLTINPNFYF